MQKKRKNPDFKDKENKAKKIANNKKRQNPDFKEIQNESNKKSMKNKRQNPDFKEKEKNAMKNKRRKTKILNSIFKTTNTPRGPRTNFLQKSNAINTNKAPA